MAISCGFGFGSLGQVLTGAEAHLAGISPKPQLGEKVAFLLNVIDHLADSVYTKDREGRYVFNNRVHREFLAATSREALVGKTEHDFFPAALAEERLAQDRTVIQTGKPHHNRHEPTPNRAGLIRWFSTSRTPLIDGEGRISAVLCVSQDITERKQAEQSLQHIDAIYRTLIEGLPQRVFFKDVQSVLLSVNAMFAKDLGRTPEELIGKTDFDLFPKELAAKYRADDQRVMQRRKPEILEEVNVSDGKHRIVEVVKVPVFGDHHELLGLLGIFTDITERKTAEARLKAFAAKLQRSNRELQDFAYVASHDLQEPLRKVAVFGARLQTKCGAALGPEGHDYLERMLRATVRMQTLIDGLLSFARVTTQAQPFVPVNLATVAAEVTGDLETRLDQVGGSVDVSELPVIEADPLQMRQLLQNLIGNALKFRRPDVAPVVRVEGHVLAEGQHGPGQGELGCRICEIRVVDNGIGFEEKYAERIFQVFQRLHSRNEYEGSGIGLAICRKIVERHGGHITAKSTPGQGATFMIRLPLTHAQEDNTYGQ
jgi:PAS domain S-box-containing protein